MESPKASHICLDSGTAAPDFSDQVICITGASRGIGNAIADAFAAHGGRLLLLARSQQLHVAAAKFKDQSRVLAFQCDVTSFAQVSQAIEACIALWGRLDVVVNAAAVLGPTGPLWETPPETWPLAIQVNLVGTYNVIRASLPYMIRSRSGKIINFAGGGAAYGYPLFAAYAASKAAVVRLTETLALELIPYNIQANSIAPGAIETDMLKAVRASGGEIRTVGTMDQAINIVTFLASSGSSHITGRFIHAKDPYREFTNEMPIESYKLRRIEE